MREKARCELVVLDLRDPQELSRLAGGLELIPGKSYVFSDEWEARRERCEALLSAQRGEFERRVGARKCVVREVAKQEAEQFLEAYHLQGANRLACVFFGLYEGEELLGLLSLGRHSRQIAADRIVLDRLCFRAGVQVVGGASKLFQRARAWAREAGYKEVISFSDNRWTDGGAYEALGFVLEQRLRSDYFYVKEGKRFSKQSQKKGACACPPAMTELEWAVARGLVRVFDAGKKRWAYNLWPGLHETRKEVLSRNCARQHEGGAFKHAHVRGHFYSVKNERAVYFGSSYELRCAYLLEEDPRVLRYQRCDAFRGVEGWRNPDFLVTLQGGRQEVLEVKPGARLLEHAVCGQLQESQQYAARHGWGFRVWTEKDSQLGGEKEIVAWALGYLAAKGDSAFEAERKVARQQVRARHYAKLTADRVEVRCDFCQAVHTPMRQSFDRNVKKNGRYICERLGGHVAGQKPKPLKQNPWAVEGKKQCSVCAQVLDLTEFDVRRRVRDGRAAACKACVSKRNALRYQANKRLREESC